MSETAETTTTTTETTTTTTTPIFRLTVKDTETGVETPVDVKTCARGVICDQDKTAQDHFATLAEHVADETNPHGVTAAQVGADPSGSAAAVQTNLNTHTADKSNPHEVTAAQVGLGNVDNTADEDKPVSTAQAAAIATAKSEAIAASASAQHTHAASDITSGTVPVARGGTGATTAEAARTNLGITPGNIGAATTDELDAVRRKVSGPSTFQRLIGWRFV